MSAHRTRQSLWCEVEACTREAQTLALDGLMLNCAAQGGGLACQVVAGVYYQAVHRFGTEAYENAQKASK